MNKLVILIMVIGLGLGLGTGCGWASFRTTRGVINGQAAMDYWPAKVAEMCSGGRINMDEVRRLLDGKFVVLLLNNMEVRPAGGFAGSYARVEFAKGKLTEVFVQDIYEPDGKLPGHVEPPYPIQEAFGQGWWKLRDAMWDVDFASAAATTRWFFEQGGEKDIDGIAVVNLETVREVLKIVGPVKLVTYPEVVTEKNFYTLAQTYAEIREEDDTTHKRGFLGAVGAALQEKIKASNVTQLIRLAWLGWDEMEKGEMMVWSRDETVQKEIETRGWGGRLSDGWDGASDYIYINETNLGANKANCCIQREMVIEISGGREEVKIVWKNENEFETPRPPVFWGGDYRDYVRVVVPVDHKILAIKVQDKTLRRAGAEDFASPVSLRQGISEDTYVVEERGGLQIIGLWAVAPAGQAISARLELEAPRADELVLKHQPGLGESEYRIVVDGMIKYAGRLDRDTTIRL